MNVFTLKLEYCNAEPILKKFFIAFMFLMKAGISFASSQNVGCCLSVFSRGNEWMNLLSKKVAFGGFV